MMAAIGILFAIIVVGLIAYYGAKSNSMGESYTPDENFSHEMDKLAKK